VCPSRCPFPKKKTKKKTTTTFPFLSREKKKTEGKKVYRFAMTTTTTKKKRCSLRQNTIGVKKGISSSMTMLFAVALASLATRASAESTDDSGDAVAPFFGFMGAASALVFSCVGAAYGTAKSGVGIASMGVMRPGTRAAAAAFRSENRIADTIHFCSHLVYSLPFEACVRVKATTDRFLFVFLFLFARKQSS